MLRIMVSYGCAREKRLLPSSNPLTPSKPMKHAVFVASLDDSPVRVFNSYELARAFVFKRMGWDLAEFGSARMCQLDDDSEFQCFYACVALPGGTREYSVHAEVVA